MPRGRSAALFDIMSSGSDSGSEMEPCACCFDLDARAARAAADEESDAITTIEREGVVLVKRTMGDVAVASVTGDCEICFLLAEVLEFFGVNPQARDYTERRIRLRIPQGSGNLEVSFQGMWSSTNYVQLFIGMSMRAERPSSATRTPSNREHSARACVEKDPADARYQ